MNPAITPYNDKSRSKKEQVADMFDNIAPRYDFLNHLLSLGIDKRWRKKAISFIAPIHPKRIVDVATGTGDFAISALRLNPDEIIGVDISANMLEVGKKKMLKIKGGEKIKMELGDSENLSFETGSVDAVTVGFGARNFENLLKGMQEIQRVLKPGGMAVILEPSSPKKFPLKQFFNFYFRRILPFVGRIFSGDKRAYTYLPDSVKAFPEGKDFENICLEAGFSKATHKPLTFGTCALYILVK